MTKNKLKQWLTLLLLFTNAVVVWGQGGPSPLENGKVYRINSLGKTGDMNTPYYLTSRVQTGSGTQRLEMKRELDVNDPTYYFRLVQGDAGNKFSLYSMHRKAYFRASTWNDNNLPFQAEAQAMIFLATGGYWNFQYQSQSKFQAHTSRDNNSNKGSLERAGYQGTAANVNTHKFQFTKVNATIITIDKNIDNLNATFTWNNRQAFEGKQFVALLEGDGIAPETTTLTCTNVPQGFEFLGFVTGNDTNPQQSLNITRQQLADASNGEFSVTAKFRPTSGTDVFVNSFDEATAQNKWFVIRSTRVKNGENYGWRLKDDNVNLTTSPISFVDDRSLWCFVGTAENFKIYNKQLGNAKVASGAGQNFATADNVAVTMQDAASNNNHWTLNIRYTALATEAGLAFSLNGNNSKSPNAYGGLGGEVKSFDASDGGGHWWIEKPAFVISDFFSENTNSPKWVRLFWTNPANNGTSVAWGLKPGSESDYNGRQLSGNHVNLTDPNTLWCLVGTPTSFKIYSKKAGFDYALTVDGNPNDGSALLLRSSAKNWSLITTYTVGTASNPGLAIRPEGQPVSNRYMSPNLYGGAVGNDIKLHYDNDGGSHWAIRDASLVSTIQFNTTGNPTDANTYKGVSLNITSGPTVTSTILSATTQSKELYLSKDVRTIVAVAGSRNCSITSFSDGASQAAENTFTYDKLTERKNFSVGITWDATAQYVFKNLSLANVPYREPAIAVAPCGDIVTFADYCRNDTENRRDIQARVKSVNGTWSGVATIATGSGDGNTKGYGLPAATADHKENKVLVMAQTGSATWNNTTAQAPLRIARIVYTKNGEQWAATTEDKTTAFYSTTFNGVAGLQGLFFASGRLLQSKVVKKGSHFRVYGAMSAKMSTNNSHQATYVVYSDDFGATWFRLGDAAVFNNGDGHESKLTELPDGSLVLSCRWVNNRKFKVFTYTNVKEGDNGTWSDAANGVVTNAPGRNGDVIFVKAKKNSDNSTVTLGLHTAPTVADANASSNVKVFYKEVDSNNKQASSIASGWTESSASYSLSSTSSRNATMDVQKDGKVGFLFEENAAANGYDIVYLPLDIATITGDTYSAIDNSTVTTEAQAIIDTKGQGFVGAFGNDVDMNALTEAKTSYDSQTSLIRRVEAEMNHLKVFKERVPFEANKYYRLFAVGNNNQVVATNYNGGTTTEDEDATKVSQFWKIGATSGTTTVINPNEGESAVINTNVTTTDGINHTMTLRNGNEASYRLKPIESVGVNVRSTHSTFYFPFAVTKPENVKIYKGNQPTLNSESKVVLKELEGNTVSANTPVVLYSTNGSGNKVFTINYDAAVSTPTNTDNVLVGMLAPATLQAGDYILKTVGGVAGFYPVNRANSNSTMMGVANKVYIPANTFTNNPSFLPITDGEEPTTGINGVVIDGKVVKYYNLNGTPVAKPVPGVLYITSEGKKVIFK